MTRVDRYPPHDVEGKESISRMYISLSLVSTSHYFRNVTRAISNSSNANINRRLFRLFLERKVIEAELSSSIQGFVHSEERS